MDLRHALHRVTSSNIILMVVALAALLPLTASTASQDIACLQKAAHDRANAMHGIFDDYANESKRLGDKLGDDEDRSLNQTDLSFRQSELDRINRDYSYGMSAAWANVTGRLKQVWTDYQQARVACGFGTTTQIPSYPTSQPPPFGNTQYLPTVPQFPYRWNGGGYYQPQSVCPQQILPTPPNDCTYSCQRDWNGCKICNLKCPSLMLPPNACACPMIYAPICGSDGRTYDNSCLAACTGAGIRYGGSCQ